MTNLQNQPQAALEIQQEQWNKLSLHVSKASWNLNSIVSGDSIALAYFSR
jgi:hypothetical protein